MNRLPLQGLTALICGGSSGIGKAVAGEVVRLGGGVVLLARDRDRLDVAVTEIRALAPSGERSAAQQVQAIAADCLDQAAIRSACDRLVARQGGPDWLINCAGEARPDYLEQLGADDFQRAMQNNYFTQLYPTLAMLPHFRAAGRGHICFTSSMMGYFGIVGYSAYAPAKFALSGLADVLQNELSVLGIRVSVVFPPDTDTPGFAEENRSKPAECAAMSRSAGCMTPQQVGQAIVSGLRAGRYAILPGRSLWLWRLRRHFPGLLRWVTAWQYARARRSGAKTEHR